MSSLLLFFVCLEHYKLKNMCLHAVLTFAVMVI